MGGGKGKAYFKFTSSYQVILWKVLVNCYILHQSKELLWELTLIGYLIKTKLVFSNLHAPSNLIPFWSGTLTFILLWPNRLGNIIFVYPESLRWHQKLGSNINLFINNYLLLDIIPRSIRDIGFIIFKDNLLKSSILCFKHVIWVCQYVLEEEYSFIFIFNYLKLFI